MVVCARDIPLIGSSEPVVILHPRIALADIAPSSRRALLLTVGVAFCILSAPVGAVDMVASFTSAMDKFFNTTVATWITSALGWAKNLFFILVGIEFAWTVAMWAIEKSDLQAFAAALVRKIMFVGFFYFLLVNGGPLMATVITSFGMAADQIAGLSGDFQFNTVTPVRFIKIGLDLFGGMTSYTPNNTTPAEALDLQQMTAVAVLTMFVALGVQIFLYQLEGLLICSAGVIFLGFGGSKFTEQFVMRYLTYAFGVGVKIFMFLLVLGVMAPVLDDMIATIASIGTGKMTLTDAVPIYVVTMMMMLLARNVPGIASSLAANIGSSDSGQGALGGMASSKGGQALSSAASKLGMTGGGAARSGAQSSAGNVAPASSSSTRTLGSANSTAQVAAPSPSAAISSSGSAPPGGSTRGSNSVQSGTSGGGSPASASRSSAPSASTPATPTTGSRAGAPSAPSSASASNAGSTTSPGAANATNAKSAGGATSAGSGAGSVISNTGTGWQSSNGRNQAEDASAGAGGSAPNAGAESSRSQVAPPARPTTQNENV